MQESKAGPYTGKDMLYVYFGKVYGVHVGDLMFDPPTRMNKYIVTSTSNAHDGPFLFKEYAVAMEATLYENRERAEKEAKKDREYLEEQKRREFESFRMKYEYSSSFRKEFDEFFEPLYDKYHHDN